MHALDLVQLVAMESSGMETERRRDCTYCNRHNRCVVCSRRTAVCICLHYAHVPLSLFLLSSNTWFMLCEFIWGDGGNVVSEPGGPRTDFCTHTDPLDLRESWWQVSFWSRALIRSLWSKRSGQDHHIRRSQAESGCLPNVCPTLKTTSDIRARRKIPGAPETQHPTDNKWQLMM